MYEEYNLKIFYIFYFQRDMDSEELRKLILILGMYDLMQYWYKLMIIQSDKNSTDTSNWSSDRSSTWMELDLR